MKNSHEIIAEDLLELSSAKRLEILSLIQEENSTISQIAKKLNSTNQEIHRNLQRLEKHEFIEKGREGTYELTNFGKNILKQLQNMNFLSKHKKYFKTHNLENIPTKFVQRIGQLDNCQTVKGFVKVHEKWNSIYENSEKYICNILFEVSYEPNIINTLIEKMNLGVKIQSIFYESAIVTSKRKKILKEVNFEKFLKVKMLERKMTKDVLLAVILNEKEAGISFANNEGEIDLSTMLYSDNPEFHEWCQDYFNEQWKKANIFQEHKILN